MSGPKYQFFRQTEVTPVNTADKIRRSVAGGAFDKIMNYLEKDPEKNLVKIVDKAEKLLGGMFPAKTFAGFKRAVRDPDNVWTRFALSIIRDTDRDVLKKMVLAGGLGAAYTGTKAVRENREKYKCNIPFQILLDPTSACNLNCVGCWSAQYGNKHSLSYEELDSIVSQGVAMGTHFYMFTGGEPLMKKDEILKLCRAHQDCVFLSYTNGTLVDQTFCEQMNAAGNLALALSLEGMQAANDARRGEGNFERVAAAMALLKSNRCLFGVSVCYTSENIEDATSDAFIDMLLEKGAKFALYFNYMPVGSGAREELIPTCAQRKHIYGWTKKMRSEKTGKPIFIMDFQGDGEYVGGCIAAGRNYFHINSAGDIEPCVFIHYSDSNIRTHTLIEALQNPLFQEFYHAQPFNDNHLRPCPMLENPEILRGIIARTGAKSTNLLDEEDVETLCSRCDKFAAQWAVEGQQLWESRPHPNPKTQYYRDTPQGKAEAAAKKGG